MITTFGIIINLGRRTLEFQYSGIYEQSGIHVTNNKLYADILGQTKYFY